MVRDTCLFHERDLPCLQPLYNFPETDAQQKKKNLHEGSFKWIIFIYSTWCNCSIKAHLCYVPSYLFQWLENEFLTTKKSDVISSLQHFQHKSVVSKVQICLTTVSRSNIDLDPFFYFPISLPQLRYVIF